VISAERGFVIIIVALVFVLITSISSRQYSVYIIKMIMMMMIMMKLRSHVTVKRLLMLTYVVSVCHAPADDVIAQPHGQ